VVTPAQSMGLPFSMLARGAAGWREGGLYSCVSGIEFVGDGRHVADARNQHSFTTEKGAIW